MSWEKIYHNWANYQNLDKDMKSSLHEIEKDPETLKDAFYMPLEFGTAGMRGILGAGINRMNIYTVRQATEGLANFIDEQGEETRQRGVAIAYDSRHMSPDFAMEAARVLAIHDIPSYVFESLRPTPELSFAVRYLKTFAGIMITASHNPAEYNGYKIYGQDGGQMPPEDADRLTRYVRKVENPLVVPVLSKEEAKNSGLIHIIGEDVDVPYLKEVKTVTINQELVHEVGKDLKLVYTPLHGTGRMLGERALKQAGFEQFVIEPTQGKPDPDFSTVKNPNPEYPEAFTLAIKLGKKEGADLLIATDPDGDRMGAAVRKPDGDYRLLTGNQIASLMVHYILAAHQELGTMPDNGVIIKSIVSSEMPAKIAASFNIPTVNTLTGFKFIAEKIHQYEVDHSHTFLFGFEESYGFLIKPFVRDKDAIQALVMLAEVACFYKKQGKTLYDGLEELFQKYGYYQEKTTAITMSGIEGLDKIKSLMQQFRAEAPTAFGKIKVRAVEDFSSGLKTTLADGKSEKMDYPASNVLKYLLEDGSWVAIRPSGTEPKIKFYVGTQGETEQAALEKVKGFEEAIQDLLK